MVIVVSKYDNSISDVTNFELAFENDKGAFTIYVDQFSKFSDPSLPIGRPFIY